MSEPCCEKVLSQRGQSRRSTGALFWVAPMEPDELIGKDNNSEFGWDDFMWRANAPDLKKHLPHSVHTPPATPTPGVDDVRFRFIGIGCTCCAVLTGFGGGCSVAFGEVDGNNGSEEIAPGKVGLAVGGVTEAMVVVGDDMGKNLSNIAVFALPRSIVDEGATWRCGSDTSGCECIVGWGSIGGAECGRAVVWALVLLLLPSRLLMAIFDSVVELTWIMRLGLVLLVGDASGKGGGADCGKCGIAAVGEGRFNGGGGAEWGMTKGDNDGALLFE